MRTAVKVATWDPRWLVPSPAPLQGGTDLTPAWPATPLPLVVEVFLFGSWQDITTLVYTRSNGKVVITRGQSSEGGSVDPTQISLTINNRDGRFSPRNPLGVWFGQIGRNTPLRVRVGNQVRATGEVSAWPPQWDPTGNDVWATITASGILRRLQQGMAPLRSPLYRHNLSGTVTNYSLTPISLPVAYWPAEDASGSTQIASATGGQPMLVTGAPSFADNSDFPGSDPIPTVALSRWTGTVPAYTASSSGVHTIGFLLSIPAAGITNGVIVLRARCTGTAARFDVKYTSAAGGALQVLAYDTGGTLLFTSGGFVSGSVNGVPLQVEMRLEQIGADVDIGFNYATVAGAGAGSSDGPVSAHTIGRISTVQVAPNADVDQAAVGHVTVWSDEAVLTAHGVPSVMPLAGYPGETAGARISRICSEEGIPYTRVQPQSASTAMGAQRSGKLIDLLRECADTDGGFLFEPRDQIGLAFRGRNDMYNRLASLELDYSAAHLSTLDGTDDDQQTRNDITVARTNGSSARATLDTGALSIQDPPDGVGRYDEQVTVNTSTDIVLADHAGWRVHLGTVDELRYPRLSVNLARPEWTSNAALSEAAKALDLTQRVTVTNLPPWLPAEDISQVVLGVTETLAQYEWTIEANLVPESPWQVGVYGPTTTAAVGGGTNSALGGADPSFESGTNGAQPAGFFGGPAPTVATSALHPSNGAQSLQITWGVGGQGLVAFDIGTLDPLTVGMIYTAAFDVYVPSGSPDVSLGVAGITFGTQYSTKDTSFVAQVTWTATGTTHQVQLIGQTPGGAGTVCFLDLLTVSPETDTVSRRSPDADVCTLAADVDSVSTTLSVATASGPLWTAGSVATAFGTFDIAVGGERMTVRQVSGTTSPQTFCVLRSRNGVVKPQTAGTAVELARPAIYAL